MYWHKQIQVYNLLKIKAIPQHPSKYMFENEQLMSASERTSENLQPDPQFASSIKRRVAAHRPAIHHAQHLPLQP